MTKGKYIKWYKELCTLVEDFCNRNGITYKVEEPEYEFSSKRYLLSNVPIIGNIRFSLEPYSVYKTRINKKWFGVAICTRFETYRNEHGMLDSSRFNMYSGKYNNHIGTESKQQEDNVLYEAMRIFKKELGIYQSIIDGNNG